MGCACGSDLLQPCGVVGGGGLFDASNGLLQRIAALRLRRQHRREVAVGFTRADFLCRILGEKMRRDSAVFGKLRVHDEQQVVVDFILGVARGERLSNDLVGRRFVVESAVRGLLVLVELRTRLIRGQRRGHSFTPLVEEVVGAIVELARFHPREFAGGGGRVSGDDSGMCRRDNR